MKKIVILFISSIGITGCHSGRNGQELARSPEVVISGDTMWVPKETPEGQRIQLQVVRPERVTLPCKATGTIRAIPECIADVAVPFDGRIVESFVKAGKKVSAGDPLFSIHSPAFMETVKTYIQAKQENRLAEMNYLRQQDLVKNGIGIQKELDEARLNYESTKSQLDNLAATLSIFNVDPVSTCLGKPLVVTAPIRGEVVRNTIRVGQYLTADSDPMVCIADLAKVWVIAKVKENNIALVEENSEVEITLDAYPQHLFTGKVNYIGQLLDESTRSLEVIIECANPGQLMKPGMFATVRFIHDNQAGILLPATALKQEEGATYVYRSIGQERYVKTAVTVVSILNGTVMVQSGIAAGDTVISEGALFLQ